ncbi:MAG TPA: gamma-glutamyltransferase [Planctomycetaceae bacterium]|nr:gamma-glutamyltransferase [Planctomycetaceae bacterium]
MRRWWIVVAVVGVLTTHLPAADPPVYQHGAVAADHVAASTAGVEILKQGGNVIDAAVATAFALSVVRPASSGLGGGGFLLYWDAEKQEATAFDYRERAPLAATADMFSKLPEKERGRASQEGILAAGVPGEIVGLCTIHQKHGKLPLAAVLAPALRLATDGVEIDAHDISIQRSMLREWKDHPERQTEFSLLWERYLNNGVPWKDGDRFFSPQRAALESLIKDGVASAKNGEIAHAILVASQRRNGILTVDDLQHMTPAERKPLRSSFHGYEVLTMPPPSSGGIALLQTLHMLEAWEQRTGKSWKGLPEVDRLQVLIEAQKHAFADRAEFLGDADFVAVPTEKLLSRKYAARQAEKIDLSRTLAAEAYGRAFLSDDAGTTHFCVMDEHGNAVACTETINTTFGSFVVEPKFGIVLNNEMDDFTALPGQPNAFGLRQSAANAIAPGKKPLSSMTPTIVLKDGRPHFIAGASGGPRIITATTQVLLQMLEFNQPAAKAVALPRSHHQWQPHEMLLEPALYRDLQTAMEQRGHKVKSASSLAASQAIRWTPAGIDAGSDPRKHGEPRGW